MVTPRVTQEQDKKNGHNAGPAFEIDPVHFPAVSHVIRANKNKQKSAN